LRGPALFALAAVLVEFVRGGLDEAVANWRVRSGDQNSYLRLALRVATGDGFDNGNYHPLVAFILSPFASRDWQFYSDAKLVNVGIAASDREHNAAAIAALDSLHRQEHRRHRRPSARLGV
jgi:hypothetical protein